MVFARTAMRHATTIPIASVVAPRFVAGGGAAFAALSWDLRGCPVQ